MKEIQQHSKDKIVVEKQTKQEKQNRLVGRIKPHKGHTLYEYNMETGMLKEAKFESDTVDFSRAMNGFASSNKKVQVNKNCFYLSALNVKNAVKKLKKEFNQPK